MASQQEKAFCELRFEVSRSAITAQSEFRARFKKKHHTGGTDSLWTLDACVNAHWGVWAKSAQVGGSIKQGNWRCCLSGYRRRPCRQSEMAWIWRGSALEMGSEHQRDSPRVGVFCALSREKERGPFFFTEATCLETHFWRCWETDYYPKWIPIVTITFCNWPELFPPTPFSHKCTSAGSDVLQPSLSATLVRRMRFLSLGVR
jgi:hypothetical protein